MKHRGVGVTVAAGALSAALGLGCGGGADPVAVGPIEVGPAAKEVMFFGPVPAPGPVHELVLVFHPPGGSRYAGGVVAVLVTPEGRRDTLRDTSTDRRGEAMVALRGRTPGAPGSPPARYRAVELSSAEPVRLSEIRWRSGEGTGRPTGG